MSRSTPTAKSATKSATKMVLRTYLAFAMLVGLFGPPAEAGERFDPAKLLPVITRLNEHFGEGFRAGQLELITDLYADDARLLEPDADARSGKAVLRDYWQGALSIITDMELTTETLEGTAEVLYETGTGFVMIRVAPDTPPDRQEFKYVNVWRRGSDGKYRIVIDIWNGVAPPPAKE